MQIFYLIVLVISLGFLVTKNQGTPLRQIRQAIRKSKYKEYEDYILNQMRLESGYLTNTLSKPPIYNPFSMGVPRIRKSIRIGEYSNPKIDDGMEFSVYENYTQATDDFIIYLDSIRMPLGLDCQGYNAYIDSKGYAVDNRYLEKLNNMCK